MQKWLSLPLVTLLGLIACEDDASLVSPRPTPPDASTSTDASVDGSAEPSYEVLSNPPAATPTAAGRGGAAATVDVRATLAAIEVLKRGGNAIDASVAAAAVLGVTDPFSCGIGGGGFMLVYSAKDKRYITIDHREKAPRAHDKSLYYKDNKPIPYADLVTSGVSIGVPGTVRGWDEALRRYGTKSLHDVLQPAIWVAEHGFVVDQTFVDQTKRNLARFQRVSSTKALFLTPAGEPRAVGDLFKNPAIGEAYRKIATGGARVFYEGEVGQKIVETIKTPPEATPPLRPGFMSMDDLSNYEVRVRLPTEVSYRGHTVVGMGSPGSGGLAVGQTLNMLSTFTVGEREEHLHRYLEASRLAFADRNAFVGDPEYVTVPQQGMLSTAYAAERAPLIGARAAIAPAKAGNPAKHQNDPSPGGAPLQRSPFDTSPGALTTQTTHLTVSDAEGNIVSYTFTIEEEGGSGIVVPQFGFLLNNELTDFDIPESPDTKAANVSEPGKRPRSSMTPSLVFKDGKPRIAVGSPGGARIITTVGQTIVNYLDFNMPLTEALAAPRVSQRNLPDNKSQAEPAFISSDIATKLQGRGHVFTDIGEIGAATGIQFNDDGSVTAVAEPARRGGGSAMVVTP